MKKSDGEIREKTASRAFLPRQVWKCGRFNIALRASLSRMGFQLLTTGCGRDILWCLIILSHNILRRR
ncbi:hypothetical protein KCP78_06845 [Salmonella enterica subsp. enterica]|nr:hypothetical protein KCP78_06845 [Salmonella enterica subsp. enterica]